MSKEKKDIGGYQPKEEVDTNNPPQGNKPKRVVMKPVVKKAKSRGTGAKPNRTKPQKIALAKKICEQYAKGIETIESICDTYGVPYSTFHDWCTESRKGYILEVQELYKEAVDNSQANFDKALVNKARASLLKKVGYVEVEETHTETYVDKKGKPTGSRTKVVKKTLAPSDNSIMFSLTNKDNDNFKHKSEVEANVKVEVSNDMSNWTLEQFEAEEKRLKKIIAKGDKDRKKS